MVTLFSQNFQIWLWYVFAVGQTVWLQLALIRGPFIDMD